ncbi:DMT family transporter, partial [Patescibacteria group bacterium]
MIQRRERIGEFYILVAGILWGLFPVITILSYNTLSPLVVLGWSQILAAVLFGIVLTVRKTWSDIVNFRALKDMLFATLFTGILFYLLFFFGLMYTTAGNAGIIALAEIFFSFCLFNLLQKESFPLAHIWGSIAMLVGALIVLSPNMSSFRGGDILILLATMVAPFGNFFQRRARALVSTESVLFVRSLVAGCVVLLVAYFIGAKPLNIPFSVSI